MGFEDMLETRHCAAWDDGRVTTVFVVFWFWRAIFKRLDLLAV